ncbi:hypothetical protein FBF48_10420 [Streptococcus salivarius]|uniref:Uncharacterized protein n=1 Tax=Streptococcus salivarius TaxID=1304 RepID=A0AAX2V0B7_STRSL|nr:hypothetical protein [Streptococcus salivarius]TNF65639.1 hypothetical protein FBF48_10420 [Streptococcus salivarius]
MKKTADLEKLRRRETLDALQRVGTLLCQGKPHIRPIGNGLYECIRHTVHDEYVSAKAASAKEAYDACFLEIPSAWYGKSVVPAAPWWEFWK